MKSFYYTRADDVATVVREIAVDDTAKFIAGGTNLIDLMKENVARPSRLIDITRLPLNKIEDTEDGGLRLGALVTNTDTAYNEQVEIKEARLALGGVAHKPWRNTEAEAMLQGKSATQENFRAVAEAITPDVKGFGHNTFKIELAKRAIVRALKQASEVEQQS